MSLFITFEGPEGSGKTTQVVLLGRYLRRKGYSIHLTREPGGTDIGNRIRKLVLDLDTRNMCPRAELLLFLAARAQHVEEVIKPKLAAGCIVICDRYVDSSVAYQGYGHGLDKQIISQVSDIATGGLMPNLTFLLNLEDVEIGLRRRLGIQTKPQVEGVRQIALPGFGPQWDRFDIEDLEFHTRVRDAYVALARAEPARWIIIDASQSVRGVARQIRKNVSQRLANTFPVCLSRPSLQEPGAMATEVFERPSASLSN